MADFDSARDRLLLGTPRRPLPADSLERKRLAAHEAGHAVVAALLRRQTGRLEVVERVSIAARGDEWSRTIFERGADDDYAFATRARLLERIQYLLVRVLLFSCVALRCGLSPQQAAALALISLHNGVPLTQLSPLSPRSSTCSLAQAGRASEEVVLREPPSSYAVGDIQDATTLARRLICNYGMAANEAGLPTFTYKTQFAGGQSLWQRLSAGAALLDNAQGAAPQWDRKAGGRQLQETEAAVDAILRAAHEQNVQLLTRHRAAVAAVQQRLLDKDNVYGTEIEARAPCLFCCGRRLLFPDSCFVASPRSSACIGRCKTLTSFVFPPLSGTAGDPECAPGFRGGGGGGGGQVSSGGRWGASGDSLARRLAAARRSWRHWVAGRCCCLLQSFLGRRRAALPPAAQQAAPPTHRRSEPRSAARQQWASRIAIQQQRLADGTARRQENSCVAAAHMLCGGLCVLVVCSFSVAS